MPARGLAPGKQDIQWWEYPVGAAQVALYTSPLWLPRLPMLRAPKVPTLKYGFAEAYPKGYPTVREVGISPEVWSRLSGEQVRRAILSGLTRTEIFKTARLPVHPSLLVGDGSVSLAQLRGMTTVGSITLRGEGGASATKVLYPFAAPETVAATGTTPYGGTGFVSPVPGKITGFGQDVLQWPKWGASGGGRTLVQAPSRPLVGSSVRLATTATMTEAQLARLGVPSLFTWAVAPSPILVRTPRPRHWTVPVPLPTPAPLVVPTPGVSPTPTSEPGPRPVVAVVKEFVPDSLRAPVFAPVLVPAPELSPVPEPVFPSPTIFTPTIPVTPSRPPSPGKPGLPVLPILWPGFPKLGSGGVRGGRGRRSLFGGKSWIFPELIISFPEPFGLERKKVRLVKERRIPYGARVKGIRGIIV
ncbi:hypothetical protein ES703_101279 [subsurface metagenome]